MNKKILILFSFITLALQVTSARIPIAGLDSSDIFVNGWEYRLTPARNGHPFVFSKIWRFDEIKSELGTRDDFLMNYDVYQDVLVIQTFIKGNPAQIVLNPANIISFTIEGHNFINPQKMPELARSGLTGYFEVIHKGSFEFLVKHSRQITDEGSIKGRAYESKTDYYIFFDNTLHSFRNKRSLIKIFPEYKKDISHFLREENIMINSTNLTSLKSMMRFIDGLVKK